MANPPLRLNANWRYGEAGARSHYLVEALMADAVIGRAHGWFEPSGTFLLEKIELDEDQRGRGYGSAMIELLRDHARANGCTQLVFKGVRADNAGAIRLYESLGAVARPAADGLSAYVLAPP